MRVVTQSLAAMDVDAVLVMGVCGCGKSSVSEELCRRLRECIEGVRLLEADSFHPPENIVKMKSGIALCDEDRQGWLESLHDAMAAARAQGELTVVACSALRRPYRDVLRGTAQGGKGMPLRMLTAWLHAPEEVIQARVSARQSHFMPASLVASQFAALEAPGQSEGSLVSIDVTRLSVVEAVEAIMAALKSCSIA